MRKQAKRYIDDNVEEMVRCKVRKAVSYALIAAGTYGAITIYRSSEGVRNWIYNQVEQEMPTAMNIRPYQNE